MDKPMTLAQATEKADKDCRKCGGLGYNKQLAELHPGQPSRVCYCVCPPDIHEQIQDDIHAEIEKDLFG